MAGEDTTPTSDRSLDPSPPRLLYHHIISHHSRRLQETLGLLFAPCLGRRCHGSYRVGVDCEESRASALLLVSRDDGRGLLVRESWVVLRLTL